MLTIALPKGRLADQTLDLMEKAGYDVSAARDKSRKLILEDKEAGLRFILSKPSDVPTYVEYGAADIGVVGKDTLLEEGRQLYEVLDLISLMRSRTRGSEPNIPISRGIISRA